MIVVEVGRVLGVTFLYFLIMDVHMGMLVLVTLMIENIWQLTTISCLTVQKLHHISSRIFINRLWEHNPHITSVEVDQSLESDFAMWFKHYKNNHRSGVDGPSRHTSGSASHRLVAARLKRRFKRDPTVDEVFFEAHTRHLKKGSI
ncbi:hypothetical protein POM88_054635 [Heracleum sosnowskyi]|uniref:Uncharacterized protein n=1 Tax=Heracleum sosnowskyi TaxID=360622 RepID=A0AAD8GLY8_9APIA|nr:hypothetical protein POM88_054635 [Heracleum sosnowskyi]